MKKINVESIPLSETDNKLIDAFSDAIVSQSTLLDSIGKQLITLELAIPGLYATALKLTATDKVEVSMALVFTFLFWFASLIFAFWAIFPKEYKVHKEILDSIESFFIESAKHKRNYIVISSMLFFAGIISSIFTIL